MLFCHSHYKYSHFFSPSTTSRSYLIFHRVVYAVCRPQTYKKNHICYIFLLSRILWQRGVEWRWAKVIYLMKNYNDKDEGKMCWNEWTWTQHFYSEWEEKEKLKWKLYRMNEYICSRLLVSKQKKITWIWMNSHIRITIVYINLDCIINNIQVR